jgi:hypothetical protein
MLALQNQHLHSNQVINNILYLRQHKLEILIQCQEIDYELSTSLLMVGHYAMDGCYQHH